MSQILERITPGFLKERSALSAQAETIELAHQKGISVDLLESLGSTQSEIDITKQNNKIFWVGGAVVIGASAAWVAGGQIPEDIVVDQFWPDLINTNIQFLTTIGSNKVKDIEQTLAGTVASITFLYVLVGAALRKTAENSLQNLDKKIRLKQKADELLNSVKNGELPVEIGPGHVAINLGEDGDAIGSALGRRLGWTKGSIPLIEGDENISGSDLWVRIHNPTQAIKREEFFASLDRAKFDDASTFVMCSLNEDQSFLPNTKNGTHFDLKPSEILDRIALVDEYCKEKGIPLKKIVVVGDKTVKSAVGPYYGEVERQATTQLSLEELITIINDQREEEIIIADPTEITLGLLNSPAFNPDGLPLQFFEDPNTQESYGDRFIKRSKALGIDVIESEDDNRKSLKIAHGETDVDTAHIAGLIDGSISSYEGTVSVIIDEARAIGEPHNTIVLSKVVTDWILDRIPNPQNGS